MHPNCLYMRLNFLFVLSHYIACLHEAMDNFDWIKDTKSENGSSHDTILMISKNQREKNEEIGSTHIWHLKNDLSTQSSYILHRHLQSGRYYTNTTRRI